MSWNTVLTFAEGQGTREVLARLPEFSVPRGPITFEEASSARNEGLACGEAPGWAVLCHSPTLMDREFSDRLAVPGRVLTLLLAGTGTVYGFFLFGGGEPVRRVIHADFEVVEESGHPLPEEADLPGGDDEDRLFGLMATVTGLTLDDLLALPFTLWHEGGGP